MTTFRCSPIQSPALHTSPTLPALGLALALLGSPQAGHLHALEVRPGDIVTMTRRIDPATGHVDPMAPIGPLGLAPGAEDYLVLTSGPLTVGFARKLWRHSPATGRNTLLAVTGIPNNFVLGPNLVAKGPGNRAYILAGSGTASIQGLLEIDLTTGEQQLIPNALLESAGPRPIMNDLVVADDGSLVLPSLAGGVLLIRPDGEVQAGAASANTIQALAKNLQGRIFGLAPTLLVAPSDATDLLEINVETGEATLLATLPGIGVRNSTLRLAAGPDGHFYVSSAVSSSVFSLHRVHGETFERTEIPLPPYVRMDLATDLDMDENGYLLLTAKDTALRASGVQIVFRIDPHTGTTTRVLGNRLEPVSVLHFAVGSNFDVFFTAGGNTGLQRVFRQDLVTGVVTLVTSPAVENPAITTRASQIAVNGHDIYVIDQTDNNQDSHLIHVDARTGEQTYLTFLGHRLFPSFMTLDPVAGDLIISAIAGHTTGCCGSIVRVRPELDATPTQVTQTGHLGNPRGIRVAPNGDIYVIGRTADSAGVYRVDPQTGTQSIVSESPLFIAPLALEILDNGDLLVADPGNPTTPHITLFRVDAATGETTVFVSHEAGTREAENQFSFIDLARVPNPEPTDPGDPEPILSATVTETGTLRILWPAVAGSWMLEHASAPNAAQWDPVTTAPHSEPDGSQIVDLATEDPERYFRLRNTGAGP
jgi:hypothetical protein